jgi:hypothetical protein
MYHLVLIVLPCFQRGKNNSMLSNILIVLLVLSLVGTLSTWPHSANRGYTLAVAWAQSS